MEIQTLTAEFCKRRIFEQKTYIATIELSTDRGKEVLVSAMGVLKYFSDKLKEMEAAVGRFTTSKNDGNYTAQNGKD